MTGPEHYRRAQQLMAAVTQETHYGLPVIVATDTIVIAAAQAHATLALTAATADLFALYGPDIDASRDAWLEAVGPS